jgi:hypothetical protein
MYLKKDKSTEENLNENYSKEKNQDRYNETYSEMWAIIKNGEFWNCQK